ncbi:unnamed protein product [marine sediment metagenome]|uniref:Uncharacterized protein n=1 Tax=marine sediment metagenome TaxID=412755 RepID=X1IV68_9ZZZZ
MLICGSKRAYAFSEIKEFEKSFQIINDLIPIIETDNKLLTDLYDSKGDIYYKRGDLKKATEFYQKALDICESEYCFIDKTREKLKECRSRLNNQM